MPNIQPPTPDATPQSDPNMPESTIINTVYGQEDPRKRELALRGDRCAVLIPCYNEEITIAKVIDDFARELPLADIYVYDNNSSDATAAIARKHGAIVRRYPIQGKGGTCRQMIRDIDADFYLMVDGDDTYPAETARDLLEPLIDGSADTVVGDRLSNQSYAEENDRAFHGFGNDLVRVLIKMIYHYEYKDVMTGYRSFNRIFAETLPVLSPGFEIETELSIHAVDKRWRIEQVPIQYRDRPEGSESKLDTFSDGFKVLMTIASLFKNYRPLKLFGLVAAFLFVLGVIFVIPVIVTYADTGLVPQIPTLIVSCGLVGSAILFLCSGLILDTSVKNSRMQYELDVTARYREMEKAGRQERSIE